MDGWGPFWRPGAPLGRQRGLLGSDVVLWFFFLGFRVPMWHGGVTLGYLFRLFLICWCRSGRLDCGLLLMHFGWKNDPKTAALCCENIVNMYVLARLQFLFMKSVFFCVLGSLQDVILEGVGGLWGQFCDFLEIRKRLKLWGGFWRPHVGPRCRERECGKSGTGVCRP